MRSPGLYVLTSIPNHPQKANIDLLCRTGALPPSRSLDNDEWRPTNSSSLVTMFGITRGLAMSFRASIVWADTAQRHQAPSDLYLPLPSSLMDELLAPRSQPSAVHTAAPRYTLSPYEGNRSQRNVLPGLASTWMWVETVFESDLASAPFEAFSFVPGLRLYHSRIKSSLLPDILAVRNNGVDSSR